MNKDVIYIEPEYDITDIINKIKGASNKIVALVPPKKAGVLRSAVNFKLIQKTAQRSEKTIVLITTDASLIRFAAGVRMPVAKNLSSKPSLPELEAEEFDAAAGSDVVEEEKPAKKKTAASTTSGKKSASKKSKATQEDVDMELEEEAPTEEEKPVEDKKMMTCKKVNKVPNFQKYQKQIVFGVVLLIGVFAFSYWALVIAPAVRLTVLVRTHDSNFSENIAIVTDRAENDSENGVLYGEVKTIKKSTSTEFSATGELDKGEKAKGTVGLRLTQATMALEPSKESLRLEMKAGEPVTVPKGTVISNGEQRYVTTASATFAAAGTKDIDDKNCKRIGPSIDSLLGAALCPVKEDAGITVDVAVEATENGDKYNTSSAAKLEIERSDVKVATASISGGTSKIVKIVTEEDIKTATENLKNENENAIRKQLSKEYDQNFLVVDSSFKVKEGQVSSSPALDQEVPEGVKPKLIREDEYSVLAIDRVGIDLFIRARSKAKLGDDTQEIYVTGAMDTIVETGSEGKEYKARAFVENYRDEDGKRSAKLKSVIKSGPIVTPEMVSEKVMGKKIGEVRTMLNSIKGVSDIKIDKSCPWVTSIPKDKNKVHIEVVVE